MAKDPNDFTEATKTKVFKRAGYQCSFPGCSIILVGPHSDDNVGGVVSIGEAAHIAGARPAPNNRYDSHMTPEQRSHHSNAIALCRTHAKLIDSDEDKYTIPLLCAWKTNHEERISREQAGERIEEEYYEKPYEKCSNDELASDRIYRQGLIKKDVSERTSFALKLFLFGCLGAVVIFLWYWINGGVTFYMVFAGAVLVAAPVMLAFALIDTKSEFILRQEAAIREINVRLKERGAE
ncbi:conserved protein of unknown function [Ectopseudomonas oleovorans]|uniref:Uncharacterized protein n=1 Tax=Ectopseudomonas oleovorans TaxID=301 RepID=A0A653BCD6_ECTOL|nr:conserved protein of unknown function [Pseudomonas oleovorans]